MTWIRAQYCLFLFLPIRAITMLHWFKHPSWFNNNVNILIFSISHDKENKTFVMGLSEHVQQNTILTVTAMYSSFIIDSNVKNSWCQRIRNWNSRHRFQPRIIVRTRTTGITALGTVHKCTRANLFLCTLWTRAHGLWCNSHKVVQYACCNTQTL